jgi:hypothetical protein
MRLWSGFMVCEVVRGCSRWRVEREVTLGSVVTIEVQAPHLAWLVIG